MKTAIIAVALCCLLVAAPMAEADMVSTIVSACTSGMTSSVCKGVMARASKVCADKQGQGTCVQAAIKLCSVSLIAVLLYLRDCKQRRKDLPWQQQ